jgi:hypothetical protein
MLKPDFVMLWPCSNDFLLESLQLSTVSKAVDGGIWWKIFVVDYSMHIPPHGKHHFSRVKIRFRCRLWLLIHTDPLSLPAMVHIQTPLFISSNEMVQPRAIPGFAEERIGMVDASLAVKVGQSVGYPSTQLCYLSKVVELSGDGGVTAAQCDCHAASSQGWVGLNQLT